MVLIQPETYKIKMMNFKSLPGIQSVKKFRTRWLSSTNEEEKVKKNIEGNILLFCVFLQYEYMNIFLELNQ